MRCDRSLQAARRIDGARGGFAWRAGVLLPVLAALGLAGAPAGAQEAAQFPVERGDVLSVTVIDEPSLSREVKVDAIGRIILPQIGGINVAGQDLDQIRAAIESDLSRRAILRNPQVIVEVASYRPFYIGGAVTKEGAIPYEPGLTVRHALLLAGGLRREEGGKELSATDLLALRTEWRANTFALLEVNSRIARLEAELAQRAEAKPVTPAGQGAGEEDAAAVVSLDTALLADRLDTRTADQQHMKDLMEVTNFELDVLAKQSAHQELEGRLQEQEVANAQILLEKGLISQPRVRELERERSQLSRNVLEVQAYTARARQNKETIGYDLEAADRKWRIETRAALREAVLERAGLQSDAEVVTARLLAAGVKLTDQDRLVPPVAKVVIHRRVAGVEQTLASDPGTEIMPGDILDVSVDLGPAG